MGVLKLACQLVIYTFAAATLFVLIPGIPPDINFEAYTVAPAKLLEDKLSPNDKLDKAQLFVDGKGLIAPESIAIRGDDIFTGTGDGGWVVRVDKTGKVSRVVRFGNECAGYWEEEICGRPLGMRFDRQGNLIVADAYYGIFRVNVDTGASENLVSMTKGIEGVRPNFPDDVDIDKDGIIYWSDASLKGTFKNMGLELFGQPSGRLIQTDPKTKKSTVLLEGIHFANGVQLSKREDFVVVSETARSRVWKYFLKGPRKGQSEILIDALPGMPDNVRSNGRGGFYINLMVPRSPEEPSPGDLFGNQPSIRKLVLRLQSVALTFLEFVNSFVPNSLLMQVHYYICHFGPLYSPEYLPKKEIIVEVDEEGNILGSLQTKNSKMSFISEISMGPIYTYFGTPLTNQLWRIKTENLK